MNKETINKKLIDNYGLDLSGKPKYRVVWSEDETEIRVGKLEEWYGGVIVRVHEGAKEVKKYSYISDRFVLEMLVPTNNNELITKMNYEPLYVFQDGEGNFLPLNWDVIEIILNSLANRQPTKHLTEEQFQYLEDEETAKQKKAMKDRLDTIKSTEFEQKVRQKELILNAGPVKGD